MFQPQEQFLFQPQPIPQSAQLRESLDEVPRPGGSHHPQPYPQEHEGESSRRDTYAGVTSMEGESVLGLSDFEFEGPAPSPGCAGQGLGATHGPAGRQSSRKNRNYGSSARIGALLEHANAASSGMAVGPPCPAASTSVLSRASLNSSVNRQQRLWDAAASASVSQVEVEKRVREEIKRIAISGKAQIEHGRVDTLEASLALEEFRMREGLGADDMFRGLVPITQDVTHVLKAKVVKKQIDPKWQSKLVLKPSMDLFDDEAPDREVRGFSLPAMLPPPATMPSLSASCGPMLVASYTRHLDFEWHDLRELPDGVLEVDRLCL